jgi:hypothetical protein
MKDLSKMAMLYGAIPSLFLSGGAIISGGTRIKDLDLTPKQPPIPKGCKEYFFNIEGEFSTEQMRKDECVFKCIASNDRVAWEKFNKKVLILTENDIQDKRITDINEVDRNSFKWEVYNKIRLAEVAILKFKGETKLIKSRY